MTLPEWVRDAIREFSPPITGKVVIEMEVYQTGITQLTIGGIVRVKPSNQKITPGSDVVTVR